jgi:hypothetical protein
MLAADFGCFYLNSPRKANIYAPWARNDDVRGADRTLRDATSRYPGLLSVVSGVAASVGITRSYNAKPWKLNKEDMH